MEWISRLLLHCHAQEYNCLPAQEALFAQSLLKTLLSGTCLLKDFFYCSHLAITRCAHFWWINNFFCSRNTGKQKDDGSVPGKDKSALQDPCNPSPWRWGIRQQCILDQHPCRAREWHKSYDIWQEQPCSWSAHSHTNPLRIPKGKIGRYQGAVLLSDIRNEKFQKPRIFLQSLLMLFYQKKKWHDVQKHYTPEPNLSKLQLSVDY